MLADSSIIIFGELVYFANPWRSEIVSVGAPSEWQICKLNQRLVALNHTAKANNLRILRNVRSAAQNLPSTVIFVMCYAKDWTSIKNVLTANSGDILGICKWPISRLKVV
jgi:hypothetical protein